MNKDAYFRKQALYGKIYITIGVLAFIGIFLGFGKEIQGVCIGLASAFLPLGVGSLIIVKKMKDKANVQKKIDLEYDERNVFVRRKAGERSFWIFFGYIVVATLLSKIIEITLLWFGVLTINLMVIVYYVTLYIYRKKY